MNRFARTLLVTCTVLALSACQQQAEPAKPAAPAAAPAAAPPAAPTAAPAPVETAAAPVADSVGVPECDTYITKYMACVSSKVPEATRAQMQTSMDQMRGAWKAAAATPEGKAGLAQACSTAHESAKQSMAAFGCTDF